ncbi:MAG: isopentenyl-diphosphate delta-isomerase idi1 [Trizodia sp. TS-e1964]|nr:MAG: isopentenyl-diphosphate delta-isomerase idi1 [Trizodia sp. TS-e1964]
MASPTLTQTQLVTAQNVLRLFPEIDTRLSSNTQGSELEGYDEEQVKLMEEVCIVLDDNDIPIGSATKKTCHLMKNIEKGLLHRAFSVFLFDSDNRLLLQQRASEKITFPNMWTNTCCSHPLGIPGETGSDLETATQGVRRAAQRKLDQELGIEAVQVPLEKFDFLTRIHYKAPSDGIWGEHESKLVRRAICDLLTNACRLVDYILFIRADVDVHANPNEVQDTRYVSAEELQAMFTDKNLLFTPWFKLICQSMLFEWWEHLDKGLEKYKGETSIRRM